MKHKNDWKDRVARHRAEGRGRRVFWLLVLAAALIAAVGLAKGFGPQRTGSQHGQHFVDIQSPEQITGRVDQMLDTLEVTDAQRERITTRVDAVAPALVELAAQRNALRDRIVAALADEQLTVSRIETLQTQVEEQSAQLARRALEIIFEIAAELTPQQRNALIEQWDRR